MALTTTLPKSGSQRSSPLPVPADGESGTPTMIESEIVIVDDDGTEEPFDPTSWFS
ncbi:hypothetical protein [Streptomyces soliscabiei]|uniref:hypothetical protein n=1 Tax=Streptomyces soliscabiei TaxID=588897 RepID=UPI0029BF3A53|nr:hypothetical protein [Streptomyces sp. NY05-11A]MDX2676784.1 hypothetical protein [Streptomyces sp. NY05-11A]